MDRAALQRLSRDALIELVIRLTELVTVVGQQQEQLAALKRRVSELEAAATERQAPAKTSENSSVPPPRSLGQAAGSRRTGPGDDGVGAGSGAGILERVGVDRR